MIYLLAKLWLGLCKWLKITGEILLWSIFSFMIILCVVTSYDSGHLLRNSVLMILGVGGITALILYIEKLTYKARELVSDHEWEKVKSKNCQQESPTPPSLTNDHEIL